MKNMEGDFEDVTPRDILEFVGELDEIREDLKFIKICC